MYATHAPYRRITTLTTGAVRATHTNTYILPLSARTPAYARGALRARAQTARPVEDDVHSALRNALTVRAASSAGGALRAPHTGAGFVRTAAVQASPPQYRVRCPWAAEVAAQASEPDPEAAVRGAKAMARAAEAESARMEGERQRAQRARRKARPRQAFSCATSSTLTSPREGSTETKKKPLRQRQRHPNL
jgi:hypothetical protein